MSHLYNTYVQQKHNSWTVSLTGGHRVEILKCIVSFEFIFKHKPEQLQDLWRGHVWISFSIYLIHILLRTTGRLEFYCCGVIAHSRLQVSNSLSHALTFARVSFHKKNIFSSNFCFSGKKDDKTIPKTISWAISMISVRGNIRLKLSSTWNDHSPIPSCVERMKEISVDRLFVSLSAIHRPSYRYTAHVAPNVACYIWSWLINSVADNTWNLNHL